MQDATSLGVGPSQFLTRNSGRNLWSENNLVPSQIHASIPWWVPEWGREWGFAQWPVWFTRLPFDVPPRIANLVRFQERSTAQSYRAKRVNYFKTVTSYCSIRFRQVPKYHGYECSTGRLCRRLIWWSKDPVWVINITCLLMYSKGNIHLYAWSDLWAWADWQISKLVSLRNDLSPYICKFYSWILCR